MKAIWFVRTRWFWRPLGHIGWLLMLLHALMALAFTGWLWLQETHVDSLLILIALGNAVVFLGFDWLARRASYREGRHCPRRQRDPEAWT